MDRKKRGLGKKGILPDRESSTRGKLSVDSKRANEEDKKPGFLRDVGRRSLDALTSLKQTSRSSSTGGEGDFVAARSISYDSLPEKVTTKNFVSILNDAKSGVASTGLLLEAMFLLEENLPADVHVALVKHLSRVPVMRGLIDYLVNSDFSRTEEDDTRCEQRTSYVASTLLANGPQSLRRVVTANPTLLEPLLQYYETRDVHDPLMIGRVSRVVYALLSESPNEVAAAMARRTYFIQGLISHVSATPASELLTQVLALSFPDSFSTLKFGVTSYRGALLLERSDAFGLLADSFCKACERRESSATTATILENTTKSLSHLAIRAMTIPKYDRAHCTFDAALIGDVNRAMNSLNAFHSPKPLMLMLDAAIASAKRDWQRRALGAVLSAMTELLYAFHLGCKVQLPTVRKAVIAVSLDPFEDALRKRLPTLCALLNGEESETAAYSGTVRVKTVELLVFLFAFQQKETVRILIAENALETLCRLLDQFPMNSILQNLCATCVEGSFIGRNLALKKAWLCETRLLERIPALWEEQDDSTRGYRHVLVRLAEAVQRFIDKEPELVKSWVDVNALARFVEFCGGPVKEHRELESGVLGGVRPERLARSMLRNLHSVNNSVI